MWDFYRPDVLVVSCREINFEDASKEQDIFHDVYQFINMNECAYLQTIIKLDVVPEVAVIILMDVLKIYSFN